MKGGIIYANSLIYIMGDSAIENNTTRIVTRHVEIRSARSKNNLIIVVRNNSHLFDGNIILLEF